MKENSREEDILNIEKYVELVIDKNYCDCNELNVICSGRHCDGSKNVAYSMQHILSDYKRVLKENEECIPKQRIEDVIDRIDYDIKKTKEIISNNSNIYTSDRRNDYQIVRLRAMNTKSLDIKKRLQKLLESEE